MNKSQSGFTLIELMITVSLLGVATVAFSTGFRSLLEIWRNAESTANLDQQAQVTLDAVATDFRNALVSSLPDSRTDPHALVLVLRKDRHDAFDQSNPQSQLVQVQYLAVPSGTFFSVDRRETPVQLIGDLSNDMELIPKVVAFNWEFAYQAAGVVKWDAQWKLSAPAPAGLKVHLVLRDRREIDHEFTRVIFAPSRNLRPWTY